MTEDQAAIGPSTCIGLHSLASRETDGEWIVGRMATGRFVAIPELGVHALRHLRHGLSVSEAEARLIAETGDEADLAQFVRALMVLGFVASVDGRRLPQPDPPRPSLPWLRPEHVRFVLHPSLPVLVAALVLAATAVLLLRPELIPTYRGLLWNDHGSAVLLLIFSAGWLLVLLHEFAHLAVARATGVPARIRFGTRLQFLVMQTDISGIELASRRHRLTAYLAGIAVNLTVAAASVLALAILPLGTAPHRVLTALALIAVLPLSFQLMVFMRTDLYFVLQDLTGCHALFTDGRTYAAYACRRGLHSLTRRGPTPTDPSLGMKPRERMAVRIYSIFLVVGTTLCLAALTLLTLPTDYALLADALSRIGPGNSPTRHLDGVTVIVLLGGSQVLWAVTWWRGRRARRHATQP